MIKESHRIALCVELFVPLARSAPVPVHVGPALAVLRGAERHLGRWLVLADVAAKAGDMGPLEEAVAKSQVGPSSARAAWSLVAWALSDTVTSARALTTPSVTQRRQRRQRRRNGAPTEPRPGSVAPPATRPTVELVARLSDRPSADRDTTFLFRMARARAMSCKPMLEGLAKGGPLAPLMDEVVRPSGLVSRARPRPCGHEGGARSIVRRTPSATSSAVSRSPRCGTPATTQHGRRPAI